MPNEVLLVWEEIPETTRFFLLKPSDDEFEKLVKCHGKFINSDEMTPELEWISEALAEADEFEVDIKKPIHIQDATVVWTGFVL